MRAGAVRVQSAIWVGGQARWSVNGRYWTGYISSLSLPLCLLVNPHGGSDDLVGSAVVNLISFAVLAASCLDPGSNSPVDNGRE